MGNRNTCGDKALGFCEETADSWETGILELIKLVKRSQRNRWKACALLNFSMMISIHIIFTFRNMIDHVLTSCSPGSRFYSPRLRD